MDEVLIYENALEYNVRLRKVLKEVKKRNIKLAKQKIQLAKN